MRSDVLAFIPTLNKKMLLYLKMVHFGVDMYAYRMQHFWRGNFFSYVGHFCAGEKHWTRVTVTLWFIYTYSYFFMLYR